MIMITRHIGVDKINEDFAYKWKVSLSTVSFAELKKKELCHFYINSLNLETFSLTLILVRDQYMVSMM